MANPTKHIYHGLRNSAYCDVYRQEHTYYNYMDSDCWMCIKAHAYDYLTIYPDYQELVEHHLMEAKERLKVKHFELDIKELIDG